MPEIGRIVHGLVPRELSYSSDLSVKEERSRPAPYVGFQSALDSTVVYGWNYYWKSTHLPEGFFAALGRFREGGYVNFLGGDEDPDRVREAYGDPVYDRLVDVKTMYDPDNVFHHNQNIRPRFV